jgi:hypothetical protein
VHRLAAVLRNKEGLDAPGVRRRCRGPIGALARHRRATGRLSEALAHFLKVTRSCWPGPFQCYDMADLPRTNNGLERLFGSYRYHERRCSGRKVACPGAVVRGSARIVAATASRLRAIEVDDLIPSDIGARRRLRASLERRQSVRTLGRRFRRDPEAYLESLEQLLINRALPS